MHPVLESATATATVRSLRIGATDLYEAGNASVNDGFRGEMETGRRREGR